MLLAAVPHSLTETAAAAYEASDATETQSLQLDLSCLTLHLKYREGRSIFLAVQFILQCIIKMAPLTWAGKLQSPADFGEWHRLPYTQFPLYQNFSTTLL